MPSKNQRRAQSQGAPLSSAVAGTATITGSVSISGTPTVQPVPAATGGLSTFHRVTDASTNEVSVKASAGQVYGWTIANNAGALRKVAFHNTAGTPTAGAGIKFAVVIPANGVASFYTDHGIAFATGIGISAVTGIADSDATAVSANDMSIDIFYK